MMRSEEEMMKLILGFASEHDEIRAVVMNGSRVNPNAKKDPFQDYDVACYVTDVEPFRRKPEIVKYFGEILILQTPEDMDDPPPSKDGGYGYLMQFMDGNRIDLGFSPLEKLAEYLEDSLSLVLVDKDNRIGVIPPPNDRGYLPQKPTEKAFADCCNEFWWLNAYVAKSLWRDELTLAHYMFDAHLRDQLLKMLTWYFGVQTDFQKAAGKHGKYLQDGIGEDLWKLLERTYADAQPERAWEALFVTGELFRKTALPVARSFGFDYPAEDDRKVSEYIRRIKKLPRDAKVI